MTLEEYKQQLADLEEKYREDKHKLAIEYAKSNNPAKAGDVVTDHIGSIVVEEIHYYSSLGTPTCRYYGTILTKKGEPIKLRNNKRWSYQCNLISHKPKEN